MGVQALMGGTGELPGLFEGVSGMISFGLPSVLAAELWISDQLFGLSALDPLAIVGSALVLAAVIAVAGYVPARWASRVDPMVAMHYDG